jgi:hypothetical protein
MLNRTVTKLSVAVRGWYVEAYFVTLPTYRFLNLQS